MEQVLLFLKLRFERSEKDDNLNQTGPLGPVPFCHSICIITPLDSLTWH